MEKGNRMCKRTMAIILSVALLFIALPGFSNAVEPRAEARSSTWKYELGDSVGFNERTFKPIRQINSPADKTDYGQNWKDGSVTGNGEIGFIESCDPNEDVFIFNNTKIVSDTTGIYETPVISNVLFEQRKGAVLRNYFGWHKETETYGNNQFGANWGWTTWCRPYQPAAQYRIKNNSYTPEYTDADSDNYNRYTNYETGEVVAQWKDSAGNEWNRRSFASRSDDVIVTLIESDVDLDLTLSIDHILQMMNDNGTGGQSTLFQTDYIAKKVGDSWTMGLVGKYPDRNRNGSKNPQPALFAKGGWGTATRIITDGNIDYQADTRNITYMNSFNGSLPTGVNDPKFTITNTKSVMLITKVDRQDNGCQNLRDVETKLYDRLIADIDGVIGKYKINTDTESYDKLLAPHDEIHGGMFRNVRIDLCSNEAEKADRALTNTELLAKQNSNKNVINKAFLERIYNNGRFGLICASGYGSTRLGAIWMGAWNPNWSGDFTLDANTNLQIAGMNTGNMEDASQGYINFILRMLADWESDAQNIYGMENAIKAPPRVDGTGQSGSYHFIEGYPHVYVNGITSWLILPIYEYWQCYGNKPIKVGKDIDLNKPSNATTSDATIASVLDLTPQRVNEIETSGYMDLEKDILYPMLMKTMNFWLQYVDDRFYTDSNGVEHAGDGSTIADGGSNAKYLFTPGYSPENSPLGDGDNSAQALTYNTAMDIAAAKDTLVMARKMVEAVNPGNAGLNETLAVWDDFESKIPEYLYADGTGELKEWATPRLADKHTHRHVSQAYAAWPAYESQDNTEIREGLLKAMERRSAAYNGQQATESHGATHTVLIQARLKNPTELESALKYLMTNNYHFASLMTSHDRNRDARSYCTDSAFGVMGAVAESLLYSYSDRIEILPALLADLNQGSIEGLRSRCNTQTDISWDKTKHAAKVTMTSDEDNNAIRVMCGVDWVGASINGVEQTIKINENDIPYIDVVLQKDIPLTVDFTLTEDIRISSEDDINSRLQPGSSVKFNAEILSPEKIALNQIRWNIVDASNGQAISGVTISSEGTFTVSTAARGKFLKVYASSPDGNIRSNELVISVSDKVSVGDEESFDIFTDQNNEMLTVNIANNQEVKKLSVVWATYDEGGKLIDLTVKNQDMASNAFGQVIIWAPGDINKSAKSSVFLWDRNTLKPYWKAIKIK